MIGIASGFATIGFRLAIKYLELFSYGENGASFTETVSKLPWHIVLFIPIIGGLIVGLILNFFTKDGRARSVSQVIEGAALYDGRVEGKAGLASIFASFKLSKNKILNLIGGIYTTVLEVFQNF